MLSADPNAVSARAKKRGLPQLGTLGAGNHYAEIQVVDEIFERHAAAKMGIEHVGQVCVMIHSGSRGLGHQVATDSLVQMEKAMGRDAISTNDRQLACARIGSPEGKEYLAGMAAAANYAWVNRSSMTFLCRQAIRCRSCRPSGAPLLSSRAECARSVLLGTAGWVRLASRWLLQQSALLTAVDGVPPPPGVCSAVQRLAGRPGHGCHLRRVAQRRQGGEGRAIA